MQATHKVKKINTSECNHFVLIVEMDFFPFDIVLH